MPVFDGLATAWKNHDVLDPTENGQRRMQRFVGLSALSLEMFIPERGNVYTLNNLRFIFGLMPRLPAKSRSGQSGFSSFGAYSPSLPNHRMIKSAVSGFLALGL